MRMKKTSFMLGTMVTIFIFASGTFMACGGKKKETPSKDPTQEEKSSNDKESDEKKTAPNTPKDTRDTEPSSTRKSAETPRDSAQPSDAKATDNPPPEDTEGSVSAAQSPFPEGKEIPHSECNTHYKNGTIHFKAKEWDKAVEAYAKYPQGKCFGRITKATDVWLAHRAFMATCHTTDNRYQEAFRKLHVRACKSWGDRSPCTKELKCPESQTKGQHCSTLYNKGTQAFKGQKYQECLDIFEEFRTKKCFGRLTKSTDLWVAYRAIVSAKKLGKGSNAFLSKLKATCRVKNGWPCKKLLKDK